MSLSLEKELIKKGEKHPVIADSIDELVRKLEFNAGNKKQNEDPNKWYINTDFHGRCQVDYIRRAAFTPKSSLVRYKYEKGEDYLIVPERCLVKLPPDRLWGNEDNPIFQSLR